jgi:cobalt-zinc-cadmium efflux system outer membrane protein
MRCASLSTLLWHFPCPPHLAALASRVLQLACLFAAVRSPLGAQGVTLDSALKAATSRNPDVRTARARLDSARAEVRIARSYANPTVTVAPQAPYQYSLAAPLDIGPQRYYRVAGAHAGVAATAADGRDALRDIRFQVRQSFYDALLAKSLFDIARSEQGIFRALLAADSARVRAGDAPERVLAKSEIELAKADAAASRAAADLRATRMALQQLMGVARPDTAFRMSGTMALAPLTAFEATTTDSLVAAALHARPDVDAARKRVDASVAALSLANALFIPVPQLALVQQRDDPFPNGQHYALGVGATVPVWNWFGGERSKASASLEQSRIEEERTRTRVIAEVTGALDQFRAAALLARRLDEGTIAKARRALETARYAYSAGAISYVELLDAIRSDGQLRADAATAAHDYWVSAALVVRALGRETVVP